MESPDTLKRAVYGTLLAAALLAADIAAAHPRRIRTPRTERHEKHEARRPSGYDTWRIEPRHDISLKAGAFPYTMSNGHLGLSGGCRQPDFSPYIFATPDAMQYVKVRYSPRTTAGGITLAYTYRAAYALSVGVAFTYTGLYGDVTDAKSGRKTASNDMTTISIAPMLRLLWLNRPTVRCYSGLAIGPAVDISALDDSRETYMGLSGTIAGVSVGRCLYGFAEVGAGMQGIFSAGIGYRF